jgi:hypothetical protein
LRLRTEATEAGELDEVVVPASAGIPSALVFPQSRTASSGVIEYLNFFRHVYVHPPLDLR